MIQTRYGSGVTTKSDRPVGGAAFLLAQLGAHAATKFAERIGLHDLTAPQAGILRLLRGNQGISQQELAERLGVLPSRIVAFVDELERVGFVQRVRDESDRRRNALRLTDSGRGALETIARAARAHEADMCAGLTDHEHQQLIDLLARVAERQGLRPGVHPGYRTMRPPAARR
ncbi:MAG: MarR family transcriptional regulator [Pseudonocardiales bacterium]|nr:MAG: MarR family transcriptional regulator [Pseudonocardiales bacterium]